ncbi:hypothetical protein [Rhodococcoides fascians]|uniref:hypothetical protein n=1 Tax=Rhodococcoides fascians TaxID=1828 RepID=UPI0005685490|nr:hypothetical protein [Rhodococcus fascians]
MGKPLSAEHKAKISAALKKRNAANKSSKAKPDAPARRPGALAASTIKGAPGSTAKPKSSEADGIAATRRSIDKIKSDRRARGEMGKLEQRKDGTSNSRYRFVAKHAAASKDDATTDWAREGRAANTRTRRAARAARNTGR